MYIHMALYVSQPSSHDQPNSIPFALLPSFSSIPHSQYFYYAHLPATVRLLDLDLALLSPSAPPPPLPLRYAAAAAVEEVAVSSNFLLWWTTTAPPMARASGMRGAAALVVFPAAALVASSGDNAPGGSLGSMAATRRAASSSSSSCCSRRWSFGGQSQSAFESRKSFHSAHRSDGTKSSGVCPRWSANRRRAGSRRSIS
mmetsp:Transcript_43155/g.80123  ORF Transcript_43155/g.80123 Transcript_43155/m.80123 type:complete len:200 (-) Transcript_43155:1618-2217(-)